MPLLRPAKHFLSSDFSAVAKPGAMISNAWPDSRQTRGATLSAIEEVLGGFPFFEAIQTVDIPFADERRAVRRMVHDDGHPHTYTLTRVLAEQALNLSSLDPVARRRGCEVVIQKFDDALEAGASTVGLIGGSCPADSGRRADALQALEESLVTICTAARTYDGLIVLIEPLDFAAHKHCTLGTAAEAVAICERLAAEGLRLKLCLDVAHLILNGEDILPAVALARGHLLEFHVCNAVTDPANALFGDHHLPFGAPGVVDVDEIARLMGGLADGGFFSDEDRPLVFCEVWKPKNSDSLGVIAHCEQSLRGGWRRAQRELTT
jgi:sugar phosphate isomerase/epimerase